MHASRRERFAWAMYDFANSGYTTVVSTTIFSAYFVAVIAGGLTEGRGTFLWTLTVGISNAIVLVSGPIVGAIADAHAWKKRFLVITSTGCIVATAMLALAGPGEVAFAMVVVIIAHIMFASGENLIAAFLPEITPAEHIGRMSGYGWGLGYLGGLATLALCLAYVTWARAQGLPETHFVPVTLLITAAVFALAAAPTFLWLRERANPQSNARPYLSIGFNRLRQTFGNMRKYTDLFRFLVAMVVFQAGVNSVIVLAAVYARVVLSYTTQELIALIMLVNVAAALGSLLMGHLQDHIGSVRALVISLLLWIAGVTLVFLAHTRAELSMASLIIGMAMGASQAGGRALVGRFTPTSRTAEFFGLWGLAIRLSAIIGPLSYGLITYATGGNQRLALLSLLVFFVVGLLLLSRVDEARGINAAAANA